jgi:hypothetical protein
LGTHDPAGILPFSLGQISASVLTSGQTPTSFGSPATRDVTTLASCFPRAEPSRPPTSWQRRPAYSRVVVSRTPPRLLQHVRCRTSSLSRRIYTGGDSPACGCKPGERNPGDGRGLAPQTERPRWRRRSLGPDRAAATSLSSSDGGVVRSPASAGWPSLQHDAVVLPPSSCCLNETWTNGRRGHIEGVTWRADPASDEATAPLPPLSRGV